MTREVFKLDKQKEKMLLLCGGLFSESIRR